MLASSAGDASTQAFLFSRECRLPSSGVAAPQGSESVAHSRRPGVASGCAMDGDAASIDRAGLSLIALPASDDAGIVDTAVDPSSPCSSPSFSLAPSKGLPAVAPLASFSLLTPLAFSTGALLPRDSPPSAASSALGPSAGDAAPPASAPLPSALSTGWQEELVPGPWGESLSPAPTLALIARTGSFSFFADGGESAFSSRSSLLRRPSSSCGSCRLGFDCECGCGRGGGSFASSLVPRRGGGSGLERILWVGKPSLPPLPVGVGLYLPPLTSPPKCGCWMWWW
mmetsp:Transcript_49492/g.149157  ORF Transcript_49492/g.149157 Transcript_49492/m.149157 type:complete len:284 (+) Transcript_49492:1002-1853(+)